MIIQQIAVFESVATGFFVILTFNLVGDSDQVKVNFSVRSHTPKSQDAMLRVYAVWHAWVSQIAGGNPPALPKGWRFIDGTPEGATSGTPDHHY